MSVVLGPQSQDVERHNTEPQDRQCRESNEMTQLAQPAPNFTPSVHMLNPREITCGIPSPPELNKGTGTHMYIFINHVAGSREIMYLVVSVHLSHLSRSKVKVVSKMPKIVSLHDLCSGQCQLSGMQWLILGPDN